MAICPPIRHPHLRLLDIGVEEPAPRTLVVRVHGDLDDAGTAALDDVVDRRLDESAPYRLVLDLSRVTLLASAAQGLLLRLHRRCRVRNVHLVLVGTAQPAVNRPLRLSGLPPLFDIRPTVEAAICVRPHAPCRRVS
jgi:anti-anti-sigma factor